MMDKTLAVFVLLFIVFLAMMWEEKASLGESIETGSSGITVLNSSKVLVECYADRIVLRRLPFETEITRGYIFTDNSSIDVDTRSTKDMLELSYVNISEALKRGDSAFDILLFAGRSRLRLDGISCWG